MSDDKATNHFIIFINMGNNENKSLNEGIDIMTRRAKEKYSRFVAWIDTLECAKRDSTQKSNRVSRNFAPAP